MTTSQAKQTGGAFAILAGCGELCRVEEHYDPESRCWRILHYREGQPISPESWFVVKDDELRAISTWFVIWDGYGKLIRQWQAEHDLWANGMKFGEDFDEERERARLRPVERTA